MMSLFRLYVSKLSLVEWIIVCAIVGIALTLVVGATSVRHPADYCMFRGGVPIVDASGRLVRCDFPVNLYRP